MDPRYPCVCCGHLTLPEPPGSHRICPVCFWEDDAAQVRWPRSTGANRSPLITAQRVLAALGACDERVLQFVRSARDTEPLDTGWRPIDPQRDVFEPNGVALAPWPADRIVLYWWRHRPAGVPWFRRPPT